MTIEIASQVTGHLAKEQIAMGNEHNQHERLCAHGHGIV